VTTPNNFTHLLVRSPPHLPCPHHCPTTPSPHHLRQLQEISSFCFMYVYEVHQPYSLTLISSILPPPSHKYPLPAHTHCTCFTVLSFVIRSKVSVKRDFSMWVYFFAQFNSFHYSLLPLPSYLHDSTVFSTHCYVLYLCRCHVFQCC
jgi:hypothetical protein